MNISTTPNTLPGLPRGRLLALACAAVLYSNLSYAEDPPDPLQIRNYTTLTPNRSEVGNAINAVCSSRQAEAEFLTRCDRLIGGRDNQVELAKTLGKVTSEQTAAQQTQALEMNNNNLTTISNRISAIRNHRVAGGLQLSGLGVNDPSFVGTVAFRE